MIKLRNKGLPSVFISSIPILYLLVSLVFIIVNKGADAVSESSQIVLLSASLLAFVLSGIFYKRSWKSIRIGMSKSARQILPAVPILLLIAMVAASWMLGGIVPTLIDYGLTFINPPVFLVITCVVCSAISVLTGSSWTTCATIGVAFMGIGSVMGFSEGWIAGAVISGAYFGDKISPLSDTTVLASSSTGVNLFDHIKYLLLTTIPAMTIALLAFAFAGWSANTVTATESGELIAVLEANFNISSWLLLVPVITCLLIVLRVNTLITLSISALMGVVSMIAFQPQVMEKLVNAEYGVFWGNAKAVVDVLFTRTAVSTNNELLDGLVSTGGVAGMLNTIYLILSAMVFGGVMMGTGMLSSITQLFLKRLKGPTAIVGTTVGSGLFLNACTADQYLSIIVSGNMYKNLYKKNGLEPRLLSRTLEDSISVTSVLIPWNSCGVTQATVLGVATLTYLPYCVFNIMCPLITMLMVYSRYRIGRSVPVAQKVEA